MAFGTPPTQEKVVYHSLLVEKFKICWKKQLYIFLPIIVNFFDNVNLPTFTCYLIRSNKYGCFSTGSGFLEIGFLIILTMCLEKKMSFKL